MEGCASLQMFFIFNIIENSNLLQEPIALRFSTIETQFHSNFFILSLIFLESTSVNSMRGYPLVDHSMRGYPLIQATREVIHALLVSIKGYPYVHPLYSRVPCMSCGYVRLPY